MRLLAPAAGEWLTYGREYSNQRFSPLDQVNLQTVRRLVPRWMFQLNMSRMGGIEATPLVADGRMYVSTSYNIVFAFDLQTREQLWRYEHPLGTVRFCCGPVNRGVALAHGLVYMATLDARLVALDAQSGQVRWNVINAPADSGYSMTMAPLVVGDRVIVGTAGGEFATRGSVTAYNARTGERLWRWYAIPSPEEGGWWGKWSPRTPTGEDLGRNLVAERGDSTRHAEAWRIGGAPVWANPAYDPELDLLYFGVGNPAPSNDGTVRPGDNLYSASIVALDVQTGKLRWYFQAVPHDVWDYDFANPPVLVRVRGRKLLAAAGKMGWVYFLDAATGELVRRSEAFVPQQNLFAVPTEEGVVTAPGPGGGANWPPTSYSPRRGLLFVAGWHRPFLLTRETVLEPEMGTLWTGGDYEPAGTEPPKGILSAIDVSTGTLAWQVESAPLWSGTLSTAGGLVFTGDVDGWFRAHDETTGKRLWEFFAGAGVNAPAISFEVGGEQFIAVAAGGSRYSPTRGAAVIVFGLADNVR